MMRYQRSSHLFTNARKYIPGGVNSPVRAFKAVGGTPVFIERAKGAYLYDVDGNRYIDYIASWGPEDHKGPGEEGPKGPSRLRSAAVAFPIFIQ